MRGGLGALHKAQVLVLAQHSDRAGDGLELHSCGSGAPQPMIVLPAGMDIWVAAGVTDMRQGFTGLSAAAHSVLEQNSYSGHVFVFRGTRGDLVQVLWFDGDGQCLFAKTSRRPSAALTN